MDDSPLLNSSAEPASQDEWIVEAGLSLHDVMREVLISSSDDVVGFLAQNGMVSKGEFELEDTAALSILKEETIATVGTEERDVDWKALWTSKLANASEAKKKEGWKTKLRVEALVVNIENAGGVEERGILQPVLKRWQTGALPKRVFSLPVVQAVIHYKWQTWARNMLLCEFGVYLVWLLSFLVFTLLFQDEDLSLSLLEVMSTGRGLAEFVFIVLALLGMVPFLYLEACTIQEYGSGWASAPWNLIDVATYILQAAISAVWLARSYVDTQAMSAMMAVQTILLWFKLQYFSRVFQPTKNAFVDTLKVVLDDVKWFVAYLVLILWAFAVAFYILFRQDQQYTEFRNPAHALVSTFSFMLGGFDYNIFYESHNPESAIVLFILFEFTMGIVLLNLLIAILSNSMDKVTQDESLQLLASKATAIDELETTMPTWLRNNPKWFPRWIQVLRVDLPDEDNPTKQLLRQQREMQQHLADLVASNVHLQRQLADLQEALSASGKAPPAAH